MDWGKSDFVSGSIGALLDEIHDRYFDISKMAYDAATQVWAVPFGERQRGPYDKRLVVTSVRACHVRDTERIRFYGMNRMLFDDASCILRLDCDILDVRLTVGSDFAVRVGQQHEAAENGDVGGTFGG
jgi:hypothetical protein